MNTSINTTVLKHYVQNSAVPQEVLRAKVKHLDLFLRGEKQPTFNQISQIARLLHLPTGLFFLNKSINTQVENVEFRTLESKPIQGMSTELRDTLADMQFKQSFLKREIAEELDFVNKYKANMDPFELASILRSLLNIPIFFQADVQGNPIKYLREKINQLGVFVFFNGKVKSNTHRPLKVSEFRGFLLADKKAPIIFINQQDSKAGQLFTLVHELVHLLIAPEQGGTHGIFSSVPANYSGLNQEEAFVNKVTAELLVPKDIFLKKHLLPSNELANFFMVSEFVILRRLFDFSFISQAEYLKRSNQLEENLKAKKTKSDKGGNYKNNIRFMTDSHFLHLVKQAIGQHKISYTDAFRLLGVSYKGYKALTD